MMIEPIHNQNFEAKLTPLWTESLLLEKRKNILIIDDSILILRNLKLMLIQKGFSVYTSSSELEGVKLFTQNRDKIGLILLDPVLSNIIGLEMYSILRTLDPEVRIVLILHDTIDLSFWENLDIDSCIFEPIQFNILMDLIHSVL